MRALILVVDDEPDIPELFRQRLRRELRKGQFELAFAASGPEALDQLRQHEGTDLILILTDMNMPGMTGLEFLPLARAERPSVPVVVVTAYGDEDTRLRAQSCGAAAFMTKPIDFSALREEIDRRLMA